MKRRHTIGGFGCGVVGWNARGKAERDLLKERLQQEIAEDYAAEMEEEGGEEEGEEMGRGWEPHTTPRSESKDEKKEKEVRSVLDTMAGSFYTLRTFEGHLVGA